MLRLSHRLAVMVCLAFAITAAAAEPDVPESESSRTAADASIVRPSPDLAGRLAEFDSRKTLLKSLEQIAVEHAIDGQVLDKLVGESDRSPGSSAVINFFGVKQAKGYGQLVTVVGELVENYGHDIVREQRKSRRLCAERAQRLQETSQRGRAATQAKASDAKAQSPQRNARKENARDERVSAASPP